MRLRQLSLWLGLVAVLLSSGCCCHRHCGWRQRNCCAPACYAPTTCCHPGEAAVDAAHPVYSAPPLAPMHAPMPGMLHAPMPVAQ